MEMSIWRDQILLFWDEKLPEGCPHEMPYVREEPKLLLAYWPHITNYARFSKKLSCFMLSFSQQNLWRIYRQFGKIRVTQGQFRIDCFKQDIEKFRSMEKRAEAIKNGMLEDIAYKMPPLAHYQHVGVNLLTFCEKAPLFVDCGCLGSDSEVSIVSSRGSIYKRTISDMFHNQQRRLKPQQIISFDGEKFVANKVVKVLKQGMKKTWRVRLDNWPDEIAATEDHEFLTVTGAWVQLKDLTKNDYVMVLDPTYTSLKPAYRQFLEAVEPIPRFTYDLVCEDPHRNFVANGMVVHNCGKTYMALTSTQEQFRRGLVTPGKVLVCGKLATLQTGWMRDCEKFTHMTAKLLWLPGTTKRKEKLIKLLNEPADIYITNHEGVRTLEDALTEKGFEKIVVDESTILKGYMGDRFEHGAFGKALMKVAHKAKWRVIMTGTPAPNGFHDLWGQLHFLDPQGFMLEPSIHDFRSSYMEETYFGDPTNPNTPKKWEPVANKSVEVSERISKLMYRVRIRDHLLDLPEKTVMERAALMSDAQEEAYVDLVKKLYTIINDVEISTEHKLVQLMKLRQITGGFLIDEKEIVHPFPQNPKMDLLDDLVFDEISTDEKVVIFCQYQWEIETIESRYKKMGVDVGSVYGGNNSKTNMANISRFIDDPQMRVVILHPRSAAHGITFTCAHYMIFYSFSYSAEEDYQAVKRIERAGQKNPMFIYYLFADLFSENDMNDNTSIDRIIYQVVGSKHKAQERLLDQGKVDKDIIELFKDFERRFKVGKKRKTRDIPKEV